jgi:hypothetical protein
MQALSRAAVAGCGKMVHRAAPPRTIHPKSREERENWHEGPGNTNVTDITVEGSNLTPGWPQEHLSGCLIFSKLTKII